MLRLGAFFMLAVGVVTGGCGRGNDTADKPSVADDPVIHVADDDNAMNAAIANARKTVQVFIDQLQSPKPGYVYSVKKPFVDGDQTEHMWLIDVAYADGAFTGTLDNTPRDVTNAREGDRYTVGRAELSDWMYTDDAGKIHGGYTVRVLLPEMRDDERRQFEAMLAPLPSP